MEMIMYAIFFYFGYRVYLPQPWVWPSSLWWAGFPEVREHASIARQELSTAKS